MSSAVTILYVEDDVASAQILTLYLEKKGYRVSHFDNAVDAQRALDNLAFS